MTLSVEDIAGWWVGERQIGVNMYYEPCGVQAIVPSEVHPSKLRESCRASQNSEWAVRQAE